MSKPVRRIFSAASALACFLVVAANASAAATAPVDQLSSQGGLCGDTGGDGFFSASDALDTLHKAVFAEYDRRGDVSPQSDGDAPAGDGKLGASDALVSLKAAVEQRIPLCHGLVPKRVVVTTAAFDFFSSGGFAVVDMASHHVDFRAASVTADAVLRTPFGVPVVINRKTYNSLQVLDAASPALPNLKECSVSDGFDSNPQDFLQRSTAEGYVTVYKGTGLLTVDPAVLFDPEHDPACSTLITGHIDLGGFDDDAAPEMDQMVQVGDELFVSLQRLGTNLKPKSECADTAAICRTNADCGAGGSCEPVNGVLAIVDTRTNEVSGSIPLSFQNPFSQTKGLVYDEFQKKIFVGGPGTTGDVLDDGAIEAIDPFTRSPAGVILSGADIHANIYDFVIVGTKRAFAIIADNESNSVVDVDLEHRQIRATLVSSTALITDIEMTETGELWVAYRGETKNDPSGLRVFDVRDDRELTVGDDDQPQAILIGQAPFTLAFVE